MLGKVGNHWCIQQQMCHRLISGQHAYAILSQEARNRNGTDRTLEEKETENVQTVVERWVIQYTELMGR
jgi:hypothetical protein